MWAILSDIHANLEALRAVLADIARQPEPVERVFCLGDLINYGPNPLECVDLVMRNCDTVLLGNHDEALFVGADGFGSVAEAALFWTRDQLESSSDHQARERRWQFLAERPGTRREGSIQFVHGSPHNPLNEYVFPEDIYNPGKMERIFALVDWCCFQGHTHVPGVFVDTSPGEDRGLDFKTGVERPVAPRPADPGLDRWQFYSPEELGSVYRLDTRKTLVNAGSVGQPRDGDSRACYVLFDGETVRFRRVHYDLKTTIRKIYAVPDLENFLGDRLREGR